MPTLMYAMFLTWLIATFVLLWNIIWSACVEDLPDSYSFQKFDKRCTIAGLAAQGFACLADEVCMHAIHEPNT